MVAASRLMLSGYGETLGGQNGCKQPHFSIADGDERRQRLRSKIDWNGGRFPEVYLVEDDGRVFLEFGSLWFWYV